ncbi:hypothetical protein NE237_025822 [Protea cynaroides]|uniref:Uncharacterized protein n=1 Tax=Protea cynaroides TaxID=273540 RepID=A0A9Q0K0J9_9MAGN|nr:hypothetical protein NE237_025822 [Protea cynaroides]
MNHGLHLNVKRFGVLIPHSTGAEGSPLLAEKTVGEPKTMVKSITTSKKWVWRATAACVHTRRIGISNGNLERITTSRGDAVGEHKIKGGNNNFNTNGDAVSVLVQSIQKAHEKVTPLPPKCSIFRVPEPMRKIKSEAYTPRLVSIGPFHHNKKHLKPMEELKLQCLYDLLGRESPANLGKSVVEKLGKCVAAMIELEGKARGCYSEIIQVEPKNEFVKMMLIDGCFILELILRTTLDEPRRNEPILNATWMLQVIKSDLLLLENQLPLFVLEHLYNLLIGNSNYINGLGPFTLRNRVFNFLRDFVPPPQTNTSQSSLTQKNTSEESSMAKIAKIPKIFNDRLRGTRRSEKKDQVDVEAPFLKDKEISKEEPDENTQVMHLLDFKRHLLLPPTMKNVTRGKFTCTRSATELKEASVKFDKEELTKKCLLDITFTDGVLRIPSMKIEDSTESMLRNLIALEQFYGAYDQDITYYAAFIDRLIDTPKDVELLRKKGIIENLLGKPEDVAILFNDLVKEVIIPEDKYYLFSVCEGLENYYNIPRHRWKASLMHNYCNTPWAFISFLAAVVLLILTAMQTVFSFLQVT